MRLLNEPGDSKFVTRKLNNVNDQSNANCSIENKTIHSTEVLKSNLCDYNDAYILVRGNITVTGPILATEIAFKNCIPFIKCFTEIDETTIPLRFKLKYIIKI